MLLDKAVTKANTGQSIITFKGYNGQTVISDGEMRDMYNLSSDKYPVLTQRAPRAIVDTPAQKPIDIIVKNGISYILDRIEIGGEVRTYLKYARQGEECQRRLNNVLPKRMVAHNNKICVWPDKVFLDTSDNQIKPMEYSVSATATIKPGSIYLIGVDLSGFSPGDAVQISGCKKQPGNNTVITIKSIEGTTINTYENSFRLEGDNVAQGSYVEKNVTVERSVPDLDFVIEHNNRLWGCRSKDNTIYSSKLGDPLNWYYYQSLADDSYALEVGSDGAFTGCVAYRTHLMFFKENCVHNIYGNTPATYQMQTTECFGIKSGSHRSAVMVNGILYYHAIVGVMAYDGGTYPVHISEAFGDNRYKNAVAGTSGKKYYISVDIDNADEEGSFLFVYDINKRIWHKEDDTRVKAFATVKNELVYIAGEDVWTTVAKTPEDGIRWYAIFGPFDEYTENMKSYKKLNMRLNMQPGAQLQISTKTDNEAEWRKIFEVETERNRTISVPIFPNRQNKFAVKIEGVGRTDIESLTRVFKVRSDKK